MTLLEIFFIVSGIIIFILALDIAKKQKFNALHFIIFLFVGASLTTLALVPEILNLIGDIFGVQRGADVLVYGSIIFLVYFALLLLRKSEENTSDLTQLVRELAIENSHKNKISGKEVFVIPSYNEGEVLASTINTVLGHGYKNILVVNDGSRDNTRNILEKEFGDNKHVTVLNHYKNRGQGAALETGFEYVRRYGEIKYLITFDADGQHDINDVKEFEKYLKQHPKVDILLGSRFLKKKANGIKLFRRIILKLGIIFTFFMSNIRLSDTHNGFRLIRLETLKDIHITIDGMGHASEIIDIIAEKKLTYKEVPVHIIYTDYSMNKGQSSMNAISIALKMIWTKFFK